MSSMFSKPKPKPQEQQPVAPAVTDADRKKRRMSGYSRKTGRAGRASTIFDSGGTLG